MGDWAKLLFDNGTFDDVAIIIGGQHGQEFEEKILKFFDKTLHKKDLVYHVYLCTKNNKTYPVLFNVYGAPAIMDVLTHLADGGCRTTLFIGYAYGGLKNLEIGRVVIPEKSYHFDGVYTPINPERREGTPDQELKTTLEKLFTEHYIPFVNGANISVPAVTFQLPHTTYTQLHASTLEMELSAFLSRAKDIGIRAAGILIVSDNKTSAIADQTKEKMRNDSKIRILQTIIGNIDTFHITPLSKENFSVNTYLSNIINDPKEPQKNIYQK